MRPDALLAVVACLALVGYGGVPSGGSTTDTSISATSTPVVTAGTPPPNETNTVAVAALPPESREAFETTLRPGSLVTFVPDSPYIKGETFPPEAAAPFVAHEYVEQAGAVFRIELTRGQLYARYRVEARSATPEPDATVVDYQNVTDSRQQAVRAAIEKGATRRTSASGRRPVSTPSMSGTRGRRIGARSPSATTGDGCSGSSRSNRPRAVASTRPRAAGRARRPSRAPRRR